MGYTKGRRLTNDFIKKEAKKYKTRSEFQTKDASCYRTARIRGILNEVCSHMKSCNFSVPQKICQQIFDLILGEKSEYNTRRVIPPYELDLYYRKFNFAIEYCGKGWHHEEDVKKRDKIKIGLCSEKNILLLVIKETSRKYEEDIKGQIIGNIDFIKSATGVLIDINIVESFETNYALFYDRFDKEIIIEKVKECYNISEFQKKYPKYYKQITFMKAFDLLDPIRKSAKYLSDKQLIDECKKINNYKDFVSTKLYQTCHRRNMLKIASNHMLKTKRETISVEDIYEIARRYKRRVDFRNGDSGAYRKALKLKMIKELFPMSYKGFRNKYFMEKTK